jgi:sugar lactone lactonase YvrE
VYRSTGSGAVATKERLATGLTVTGYRDTTAIPGTTYFYQVTAYNATGDSTASPEVSARIKATPAADILMGGALQGVPLTMAYRVATMVVPAAPFNHPIGITTDGKNLFVADTFNNSIRKIIIATGEVSLLAGAGAPGSADGIGTAARFNALYGITTDGTSLFVADFYNHAIRRVDIASGSVTTLAGSATFGSSNGSGAAAGFKSPRGITTDGTNVYVADSGNRTVRKIVIVTGAVTTIAGSATAGAADGVGTSATFATPEGLAIIGSTLFLTDSANHTIRRIDLGTAAVTTLAGSPVPGTADGIGSAAAFNTPAGITTDGTTLYVADSKNNSIRAIDSSNGAVTTVSGSGSAGRADGDGVTATFSQPKGLTTDGVALFVTDYSFSLIREIL